MPRTSKTYTERELRELLVAALGLADKDPKVEIRHTPEQRDGPHFSAPTTVLVVSYDEALDVPV